MKTAAHILIVHLLAACTILPAIPVAAQNLQTEQTRKHISAAAARIDSLIHAKQMLADSAAILAFEIRSLTGADKGRKEHRRLEHLLAVSKEITSRDQAVTQELTLRYSLLKKQYSSYSSLLLTAIDSLLTSAADAPVSSQKDLAAGAAALTKEKHIIDLLTYKEDMQTIVPAKIASSQWDTPSALRLKSSMLTDRAQALGRQKQRLNKLIHELENEQRVRNRINEFSIDMALFNENEEHSITSAQSHIEPQATYDSNSEKLRGSENTFPLSENIPRTMPSAGGSFVSLQDFIELLKTHSASIGSVADSLQIRSRIFLNLAAQRESNEQQ